MYNQKPLSGDLIDYGHPLSQGLVGLWLFNEGSGGQVFDLSGYGNTGTFVGDVAWATGAIGSMIDFPGADDEILFSKWNHYSSLINNCTIIARVNTDVFQDRATIVIFETNFWFRINNTANKAELAMQGGIVVSDTAMVANVDYDIGFTWDGTNLKFYQNGIPDGTSAPGFTLDTPSAFRFGSQQGTLREFNGQLGYVIIYNRVLSASEVALLYLNPFCMVGRRRRIIYDKIAAAAADELGAFNLRPDMFGTTVISAGNVRAA